MAKIFFNALTQRRSYKRLFAGLILFILALNIICYVFFRIRTAEIESGSIQVEAFRLFVLITALCSSVIIIFLVLVYFQFKNTTILIGSRGIAFLSILRKIRSPWDEVEEVILMKRQSGDVLHISTANGSFKIGAQFVEESEDADQFRLVKQNLMVLDKNGEMKTPDIKKTSIYKIIEKHSPVQIRHLDLRDNGKGRNR